MFKADQLLRWKLLFVAVAISAFFLFALSHSSQPLKCFSGKSENPTAELSHSGDQTVENVKLDPAAHSSHSSQGPAFKEALVNPHHNYTKAVIVSSIKSQSQEWIHDKLKDFKTYVYVADDPSARLTVPVNKGREAMVYLSFIIDFYDDLPDIMIFLHNHRHTYHNPGIMGKDSVEMVKNLIADRVVREGYINMHCSNWVEYSCPASVRPLENFPAPDYAVAWQELFPGYDLPAVLSQHTNAQFAVHRERVRQIPKENFVTWRQWIIDTPIASHRIGWLWESFYQFVFTGRHIYCPEPHVCYCDGFGFCLGGRKGYDEYNNLYLARESLIGGPLEVLQSKKQTLELTEGEEKKLSSFRQIVADLAEIIDAMARRARERGADPDARKLERESVS